MMTRRVVLLVAGLFLIRSQSMAQTTASPSARLITLREAVELALQHNHVVRVARLEVEEHEHVQEAAKSAFFPSVRNDTNATHVSDTQLIELSPGSLGNVGGALIPPQSLIVSQGGLTVTSTGFGVVQPLLQLFKINAANDVARAAVQGARGKARNTENDVALKVHQVYYRILIAEAQRKAIQARVQASEELQSERVQLVKYGSALETDLIESRAQSLQVKQELLSNELQLADLHMDFNDVLGLPLGTAVVLDPSIGDPAESCAREACIALALDSHPEVAEARAAVEKAEAAVRVARYDYLPDMEAYARYSIQNNAPFLASHFGTIGIHFSYDLFDGGKKRATLAVSRALLGQATENLERVRDEVELRVATAYNKLERTHEMMAVSQELVALRTESYRVVSQQLTRGAALHSQASASLAQELDATALLLQSRLDYVQAVDELDRATGRTPR